MYGRGINHNLTPSSKKHKVEEDIDVVEWAPIDELISYLGNDYKKFLTYQKSNEKEKNPFRKIHLSGPAYQAKFHRPIIFESKPDENLFYIFGGEQLARRL